MPFVKHNEKDFTKSNTDQNNETKPTPVTPEEVNEFLDKAAMDVLRDLGLTPDTKPEEVFSKNNSLYISILAREVNDIYFNYPLFFTKDYNNKGGCGWLDKPLAKIEDIIARANAFLEKNGLKLHHADYSYKTSCSYKWILGRTDGTYLINLDAKDKIYNPCLRLRNIAWIVRPVINGELVEGTITYATRKITGAKETPSLWRVKAYFAQLDFQRAMGDAFSLAEKCRKPGDKVTYRVIPVDLNHLLISVDKSNSLAQGKPTVYTMEYNEHIVIAGGFNTDGLVDCLEFKEGNYLEFEPESYDINQYSAEKVEPYMVDYIRFAIHNPNNPVHPDDNPINSPDGVEFKKINNVWLGLKNNHTTEVSVDAYFPYEVKNYGDRNTFDCGFEEVESEQGNRKIAVVKPTTLFMKVGEGFTFNNDSFRPKFVGMKLSKMIQHAFNYIAEEERGDPDKQIGFSPDMSSVGAALAKQNKVSVFYPRRPVTAHELALALLRNNFFDKYPKYFDLEDSTETLVGSYKNKEIMEDLKDPLKLTLYLDYILYSSEFRGTFGIVGSDGFRMVSGTRISPSTDHFFPHTRFTSELGIQSWDVGKSNYFEILASVFNGKEVSISNPQGGDAFNMEEVIFESDTYYTWNDFKILVPAFIEGLGVVILTPIFKTKEEMVEYATGGYDKVSWVNFCKVNGNRTTETRFWGNSPTEYERAKLGTSVTVSYNTPVVKVNTPNNAYIVKNGDFHYMVEMVYSV